MVADSSKLSSEPSSNSAGEFHRVTLTPFGMPSVQARIPARYSCMTSPAWCHSSYGRASGEVRRLPRAYTPSEALPQALGGGAHGERHAQQRVVHVPGPGDVPQEDEKRPEADSPAEADADQHARPRVGEAQREPERAGQRGNQDHPADGALGVELVERPEDEQDVPVEHDAVLLEVGAEDIDFGVAAERAEHRESDRKEHDAEADEWRDRAHVCCHARSGAGRV